MYDVGVAPVVLVGAVEVRGAYPRYIVLEGVPGVWVNDGKEVATLVVHAVVS